LREQIYSLPPLTTRPPVQYREHADEARAIGECGLACQRKCGESGSHAKR
jgi:hypothetical protein